MILDRGLAKYAAYIILFATMIFYSSYFTKGIAFALSYLPLPGNTCAYQSSGPIGNTNFDSSVDSGGIAGTNLLRAYQYNTASAITVDTINAYFSNANSNYYAYCTAFIYSDNSGYPGNKMVESAVQNVQGNGWRSFPISSASLASGNWWIGTNCYAQTNGIAQINYATGNTNQKYQINGSYGGSSPNSPSTFPASATGSAQAGDLFASNSQQCTSFGRVFNYSQTNCQAGQYIPNFPCAATAPSCQPVTASNSCGGACSDCNGNGTCITRTCVPGNNFACGVGNFCNSVGSCSAPLSNGASCSDCNLQAECASGNCGAPTQLLLPVANGTVMQFVTNGCSPANSSSCVNTNDTDISFVSSSVNAQGDWKTQPIIPKNTSITKVSVFAVSKYSGAGTTPSIQSYLVVNGTASGGNFIHVNNSYDTYWTDWFVNPNTSRPWQPNDLNNLSIGVYHYTTIPMYTTYVYGIAYYKRGASICCDAGFICCQNNSDCPKNAYCSNNDCVVGTPLRPAYISFKSFPFVFIFTSITDSQSNSQGLSGYNDYLNIFWYVQKNGAGNPNIGINCTFIGSAAGDCYPKPVTQNSGNGGCSVPGPQYDYTKLNNISCLVYDTTDLSTNATFNSSFYPIAFTANASLGSLTVGTSAPLRVNIINTGLRADNYTINISSNVPYVSIDRNSSVIGPLNGLPQNQSSYVSTDIRANAYFNQPIIMKIYVNSTTQPQIGQYIQITITAGLASLADFTIIGIIQIIILAALLLLWRK